MTGSCAVQERQDGSTPLDDIDAWLKYMAQHCTLGYHAMHPDISIESYSHQMRLELGAALQSKRRIYLDVNRWIHCRDARMGQAKDPMHADLWARLAEGARCGRVVCPVSFPVFSEVLKQKDLRQRAAMSKVVDILSGGVTLQPFPRLQHIELAHLLGTLLGNDPVHLIQLVWTWSSFVVGEHYDTIPHLSWEQNLAMQKAHFDDLRRLPFSVVIENLPSIDPVDKNDRLECAKKLTMDCRMHKRDAVSFDRVFHNEIRGYIQCMRSEVHAALIEVGGAEWNNRSVDSPGVTQICALLAMAFVKRRLSREFPSVHIGCSLHAFWRRGDHEFEPNDTEDRLHAQCALPYCDAFFTEKSLAHAIESLKLDTTYGCRVAATDRQCIQILDEFGL